MLPKTLLDVFRARLKADQTLPVAERNRLLALLDTNTTSNSSEVCANQPQRILKRKEVARRFSVALKTVDRLPIKKITLPGRKRASGFLESDVNALIQASIAA